MVGVPPATYVLLLVGLLFDQGNLRMLAVGLKETIDIDVAPALSKCNVIQLIEGLITMKEAYAGKTPLGWHGIYHHSGAQDQLLTPLRQRFCGQ